jgi:hypothetical protein
MTELDVVVGKGAPPEASDRCEYFETSPPQQLKFLSPDWWKCGNPACTLSTGFFTKWFDSDSPDGVLYGSVGTFASM